MVTPTIEAEARTVVHTQALDIVERDSSERSIPIIAAIAIANEIDVENGYSENSSDTSHSKEEEHRPTKYTNRP